ncbi:TonB-dependent receptor [Mangrovibacterium lignilyticum]|uniref:TonB-dependent receptor n=1 Tax=Mangrovibacterium lignilyticum TaxID=2668052 RepID=UPI001967F8CC|nr:TonB-dependent receptor [Mangrovibacterium lignilyticum]
MKLTVLLTLLTTLSVFGGSFAQNSKLNLKIQNRQIKDVLNEIENQSNYSFMYDNKQVDVERHVSLDVQGESLDEVLMNIFEGTNVTYKVIDRHIMLVTQDSPKVMRQASNVTGTVVSATGEPLPGVTIVIKGTNIGTITDFDGNFSLKDVSSSDVLVFSFIGMVSQEIPVGTQSTFAIVLEEETVGVDEVVVIGYGTTSRKDFTGSVSRVDMENSPLALTPRTDVSDALRAVVPGMTVSQQQGAGQSPSILVRGQKSINSSATSPLIVLDGVIFMGDMRDIDPSTIEDITVLKDATSVAAYGSRAANGVVVITTKSGKKGKPVINFNSSVGISQVINKADVLSPENWVRKVNLLQGLDEDADPTSWMSQFEAENYAQGKTIDWQDYVSRTGVTQNYALSVSGANEKSNYYMAASYNNTEGVLIGDDYSRIALTSRLNTNITDWLEVGGNINFSVNDYSGPTNYNIYQSIRLTPYGRAYRDEENGLLEKFPATEGIYRTNPLWSVESNMIDDNDMYYTTVLDGHMLVDIPWIKGLSYRMNYSYTLKNVERDYFTHEGYYVLEGTSDDRYSASSLSNFLTSANGYSARTKSVGWVWDNIINYKQAFGKHYINFTGVYTRDSYDYKYKRVDGSDFSDLGNTELGYNGLTYAKTQTINSFNNTLKTNIGYLARINYNYADKYHLTTSVRRDGSSVFGENSKWGTFYSLGLGWTVTNEGFMEDVDKVDYLKLKLSWGQNGNQSLSPYQTLSTLTLGQAGGYSYPFGNTSEVSWGQRIAALGNTDLGWEKTSAINTGFELTMFKNKISLNTDFYVSQTTNQIFERNIPVMGNGITSIDATLGQVNNWGLEATLTTTNVKNSKIEWTSSLTYYLNRNKLKELYGDGNDDISNSLFLGESLGAIYGYKPIGIVQEDDAEYMNITGAVPGDVKFYDREGDGIDANDRVILGYNKDNFRMSFANTVRYKGFELYALLSGVFGGNGYYQSSNIYAYRTASDVVFDNNFNHGWWTAENKSDKYPRIGYTDGRYNPLQSRGFVRLQNVSLSYTFDQLWVKALNLSNFRVYASATNLFTITGWEGGDPETGQTLGSGYSYGYPLSSTYSFGLSLTF